MFDIDYEIAQLDSEAMANRLNQLRNRSREAKKFLSLTVAFSSRARVFSSRSRFGRGPVEATVTWHALNALTASEPVDP